MAYDQTLTNRVRTMLSDTPGMEERPKMGGLSFMVNGKVCIRVQDDDLLVRCKPELTDTLLAESGARRYQMKNKPNMKGWILVDPQGTSTRDGLDFWVRTALAFFQS